MFTATTAEAQRTSREGRSIVITDDCTKTNPRPVVPCCYYFTSSHVRITQYPWLET